MLVVKNSSANAGEVRGGGSIPGLGRSPGEGNCNPFQYSCLGNPMDRGTWQAAVHGFAKRLMSDWHFQMVTASCFLKIPIKTKMNPLSYPGWLTANLVPWSRERKDGKAAGGIPHSALWSGVALSTWEQVGTHTCLSHMPRCSLWLLRS